MTNDAEILNQIAATKALMAENERLIARQKEVVDEVHAAMAELLGCSIWDLESKLDRDLSAEERQELEQQAKALLLEAVPGLVDVASPTDAPTGLPAPSGAPRPRRPMV